MPQISGMPMISCSECKGNICVDCQWMTKCESQTSNGTVLTVRNDTCVTL